MDENKGKLTEGDQSAVRAAIQKVNEAKKEEDPTVLNRAMEDLQRAESGDGRASLRRRRGPRWAW